MAEDTALKRRPPSITVVSWIFIAIGAVTLVFGLVPSFQSPAEGTHREGILELAMICGIRLAAVVGGAFMLRGANWARWLMVVWVAFHLGISSLHSAFALIVHAALFGVMLFLMFRPAAAQYFRGRPAR